MVSPSGTSIFFGRGLRLTRLFFSSLRDIESICCSLRRLDSAIQRRYALVLIASISAAAAKNEIVTADRKTRASLEYCAALYVPILCYFFLRILYVAYPPIAITDGIARGVNKSTGSVAIPRFVPRFLNPLGSRDFSDCIS